MKITSLLLGPALSLAFLLSPARAEDPAPPPISPEMQALLADLLKQVSNAAATTNSNSNANANAAPKDAQSQELQTLLISVLKNLSQMLPQIMANLDTAQAASADSSRVNVPDTFDPSATTTPTSTSTSTPTKAARPVGLSSGGLTTNGLNPGGSSNNRTDEQWRALFQKSGDRR